MPLYEYKCHGCGKTFEVIQRFSDEPLKTHSDCGGTVERLISPPAIQFKGTGWYVTDYGKGNGKSPKSEPSAESKSETRTEPKADSKPDTKAAADSKSSSGTKDSKPSA